MLVKMASALELGVRKNPSNSPLNIYYVIQFIVIIFTSIDFAHGMRLSFPDDNSSEDVTIAAIQKCPNQTWFHNETQSCWPSKQRGPCPKSMIFYAINQKYGDCDCPDISDGTAWVYDIVSDQCFKTYQQAFCQTGEWLVFDGSDRLACIPNQCADLQRNSSLEENEVHPMVLYRNKCVRLMQSSGDERCPSPYVMIINKHTGAPLCSSEPLQYFDISVKGRFKCRPGTRRDRLGKCRPLNTKVSLRPSSESESAS